MKNLIRFLEIVAIAGFGLVLAIFFATLAVNDSSEAHRYTNQILRGTSYHSSGFFLTNKTAAATGSQMYAPTNQTPRKAFTTGTVSNHPKSYAPGSYGHTKTAPMFIAWREWDGTIRYGGVAKSLSGEWNLGDIGTYFAVEIQGLSGCANHEQLMFGPGTTNIVIGTNYTGTIQIGTNFYHPLSLVTP